VLDEKDIIVYNGMIVNYGVIDEKVT